MSGGMLQLAAYGMFDYNFGRKKFCNHIYYDSITMFVLKSNDYKCDIFGNIHITKSIYINNNRKYRNLELLFEYNKYDYNDYLSNSLNNIFKTTT